MDRCWLLIGAPAQRPQIRSVVVDSKAPLFQCDHWSTESSSTATRWPISSPSSPSTGT